MRKLYHASGNNANAIQERNGVCKYFGSGLSESGFSGFKDFQDYRGIGIDTRKLLRTDGDQFV